MRSRVFVAAFFLLVLSSSFGVPTHADLSSLFGGNPAKKAQDYLKDAVAAALGVDVPLKLDQSTAFAEVPPPIGFRPRKLTSISDLNRPLAPGDYAVDAEFYCTEYSIHRPARGLPYKLAHAQGRLARPICALLNRGTLQGIDPAVLNVAAWRIEAGVPIDEWPALDQAMAHKLIPDYENSLHGDFVQQMQHHYDRTFKLLTRKSFDDELGSLGGLGQQMLSLEKARQLLTDQSIADDQLPDMLYQQAGNGTDPTQASDSSSPSPWMQIRPGVIGRYTIVGGYLHTNLFEFRVAQDAAAARALSPSDRSRPGASIALAADTQPAAAPKGPTLAQAMAEDESEWDTEDPDLVGYPIDQGSQDPVVTPILSPKSPDSPLPEVTLIKATTTDAQSVTVDYSVSPTGTDTDTSTGTTVDGDDTEGQGSTDASIDFKIYRSENSTVDPDSSQDNHVQIEIGEQSVTDSQSNHSKDGNSEIKLSLDKALIPDTAMPYVVVVATCNGQTSTTYFRKWLLGAIAHGYNFFAPNNNSTSSYIPIWSTSLPDWEPHMKTHLIDADKYNDVIAFNWEKDCATDLPGLASGAGYRLGGEIAAEIAALKLGHPGDVVDLHLIGHSRGTVVVAFALKFLALASDNHFGGAYVSVTLLDPHPANNGYGVWCNASQRHLGQLLKNKTYIFQKRAQDERIEIPKGIRSVDVWYQKNLVKKFTQFWPWGEENFNLWGMPEAIDNDSGVTLVTKQLPVAGYDEGLGHGEVPLVYDEEVAASGNLDRHTLDHH